MSPDRVILETSPATEAWQSMLRLGTLFRDRLFEVCGDLDLSPPQLHALRELTPGTAVAMRDLAQKLRCDASNVTGIVDRLEARGLVERRPDPDDRRVKAIAVTAKGVDLRDQILARMNEVPSQIASLSRNEQEALRDILGRALGAE
jgi:DNA-binding MarR family transcriptional regulator